MRIVRAAPVVLSCLALLTFTPRGFAQTTGDLRGTVYDAAGGPLPGVTVEITSMALLGSRTTSTDVSGQYRFPLVPPGVYRVAAKLAGFRNEERTGVRVGLGETASVSLTLVVETTAAVEVTGEAPLVDTASTRIGTSMPAAGFTKLPLGRNYSSAMLTVGGTGQDFMGNTSYGATGLENTYVVDGLNTTGVLWGNQGKQLNLEFVQEVEVRTGGYEAEFGRAMGASLNVITKSGGNEFRGDVFGYYDSGSLAADDEHAEERAELNLALPVAPTRWDLGLNFGGYFVKDRLWFFGAYDRVENDADYQRVESLTYTPDTVESNYVDFTNAETTDIFSAKLTLRAGPSHTLVASVFGDPTAFDYWTGAGPPSATVKHRETGGTDVVGRWEGLFGSSLVAQAQYGYHEEENTRTSPYADLPLLRDSRRGFVQAVPGSGPGYLSSGTFRRNAWTGSSTAFLGGHELKGGVAYEYLNSTSKDYYSGGGIVTRFRASATGAFRYSRQNGFVKYPLNCQVRTDGSRGDFGFVDPTTCNGWEPAEARASNPRTRNLAFFVQDTWRVFPSLSVNAGVRYEEQRLYDAQGQPRIELTGQWSPRVGVVWDPLGNGRSKVHASFGRYYQFIPQAIQTAVMGAENAVILANYTEDHVDLVNDSSLWSWPYLVGSDYVPPGIKGVHQDEFVAGVEAEVWRDWSIGLKGVYRSLGRALEDRCDVYDPRSGLEDLIPPDAFTECVMMNPGEGEFGQLSDPTDPDCWEDYPESTIPKPCESVRAVRVFRGLQLDVRRRFSDRFQLQASYLWSQLEGNYDGFVSEWAQQAAPALTIDFDNPDLLVNGYGALSLDRTHQAKLSGSYAFPFGLQAGVSFAFATGAPLSIMGVGWADYPTWLEPRGSWDQLPSTYKVDLHLEYPLRIGPVTVTPLVDVFNLTNAQTATARGEFYNDEYDGDQSPPYTNPSVPDFGKDIEWQAPRVVRLGARVSF